MRALYLAVGISLMLGLGGCTEFYAGKEAAKSLAQQVADEKLKIDLYNLCNAESTGAVRRGFGLYEDESRQDYELFCEKQQARE